MEATGDIGRGNIGHYLFVKAQFVGAETFPQIAVEIYLPFRLSPPEMEL
jgi:hypothetical protein